MDHYPGLDHFRVKDEPLEPVEWLNFSHGEHEPCKLKDYPIIRGWSSERIHLLTHQNISQPFSNESLALIQSWMFLGSLEALTRRRISSHDFLRRKFGRPAVHTGFIISYLVEWVQDIKEMPESSYEALTIRINAVLNEVQSWCHKLAASPPATFTMTINGVNPSGEINFAANALDSVARLLTLVGETIRSAVGHFPRAVFSRVMGFVGAYTADEASRLVKRLVKKGWCPYMARMLFTYRYSIAEYAAFYSRFKTLSVSKVSHDNARCTEAQCLAHDVDTKDYVTRHTIARCSCPFVFPPLNQMLELLEQGSVPVVFLTTPDLATSDLSVASSAAIGGDGSSYLAFSHVWSDGLGSNAEKGLPRCVVNKLFAQARAYGHKRIWMDSLCVPSDDFKAHRETAIKLMAMTYENASITVVLDSSIRAVSFDLSSAGIAQTLLSLVTSVWFQRLWTLQEACLSKRLVFQFQNTMASAVDIWLGLIKISNEQWHVNPVTQHLGNTFFKLFKPSQEMESWLTKELELGDICNMLQRRRTSKLIDETIAVAGLVNVDVNFLLAGVTPEDRMRRFFISLRRLPSAIIMSPLPRLDFAGFKWAPASFMSHNDTDRRWSLSTGDKVEWAECFPGGGLRGRWRLTRLSVTVSINERSPSIAAAIEGKVVKIKHFPPDGTSSDEDLTFSAVASLPDQEKHSFMGLHWGAALLAIKRSSVIGAVEAFEYRGRVMIGDMSSYAWTTADIQDRVVGKVEEQAEILIM